MIRNPYNVPFYNGRVKLLPDADGMFTDVVQVMICNRPIFNPTRAEISGAAGAGRARHSSARPDDEALAALPASGDERAIRRARNRVDDLIACNQWDYFITLTLDGEKIDRTDYGAVIRKLNAWLSNRVQRRGLRYVMVPEYHADGEAIHFHGVIAGGDSRLQYSGHRTRSGGKLKRIYNITDWTLGYTTAIRCDDNSRAVAAYIGKYITKAANKVGGRYYLHGGVLREPEYQYFNADYDTADGAEYVCGGGTKFKFCADLAQKAHE